MPDIRNHPVAHYLRAGVPVLMGADDPGLLDQTIITCDSRYKTSNHITRSKQQIIVYIQFQKITPNTRLTHLSTTLFLSYPLLLITLS